MRNIEERAARPAPIRTKASPKSQRAVRNSKIAASQTIAVPSHKNALRKRRWVPSRLWFELGLAISSVMKLQHHAARSIIWSEGFTSLAKALPYSWPEQEERTVGPPGYYFPVCENPRHSRGLRWRTPVSDRRLLAFRSSRGGFRALVSGAIFQFPFRRGGDRLEAAQWHTDLVLKRSWKVCFLECLQGVILRNEMFDKDRFAKCPPSGGPEANQYSFDLIYDTTTSEQQTGSKDVVATKTNPADTKYSVVENCKELAFK
jgi:hypothetical protein